MSTSTLFCMAIVCVMSGMADIVTEIHVLTSHFTNGANDNKHAHHHEIETAIAANVANPAVTSVHVLYEWGPKDRCPQLRERIRDNLSKHWPGEFGANLTSVLGCTETPNQSRITMQEILAIYPRRIFGSRASDPSSKLILVVINGDIVLDRSVRRLKSMQWGHAATLSVNTGPEMVNCCLDDWPANIKNVGASCKDKSVCLQELPDPDTDPHTVHLRKFYRDTRDARVAKYPLTAEHTSGQYCAKTWWSSSGFQFCGRPNPAKGQTSHLSLSWDGYAFVLPLPAELYEPGNPWFKGIPKPDSMDDVSYKQMKQAAIGTGTLMTNNLGVEARTLCALRSAGLQVHAPCEVIRVAHWHCEAKTHMGKNNRFDRQNFLEMMNDYVTQNPKYGKSVNYAACSSTITSTCPTGDCGGIDVH